MFDFTHDFHRGLHKYHAYCIIPSQYLTVNQKLLIHLRSFFIKLLKSDKVINLFVKENKKSDFDSIFDGIFLKINIYIYFWKISDYKKPNNIICVKQKQNIKLWIKN